MQSCSLSLLKYIFFLEPIDQIFRYYKLAKINSPASLID